MDPLSMVRAVGRSWQGWRQRWFLVKSPGFAPVGQLMMGMTILWYQRIVMPIMSCPTGAKPGLFTRNHLCRHPCQLRPTARTIERGSMLRRPIHPGSSPSFT